MYIVDHTCFLYQLHLHLLEEILLFINEIFNDILKNYVLKENKLLLNEFDITLQLFRVIFNNIMIIHENLI